MVDAFMHLSGPDTADVQASSRVQFAYTGSMSSHPSVARVLRWLSELLLVLPVLAAVRHIHAFPSGDDPAASLVSGPDAGAWAINAIAVASGDLDQVDPYRLPTFLILLVAASGITGDIPQAGHLVGMLAWVSMVLATALLGRAAGGPLVGSLAGLLIATPVPLVQTAARFSVDPVLAAILPLALAAVAPARQWWWFALPAGVAAGAAVCTHLTALPYALPALLLLLLRGGRPGEPDRVVVGRVVFCVLGVAAVLGLIWLLFPSFSQIALFSPISEGISSQRAIGASPLLTSSEPSGLLTSSAWDVLRANSTTAWYTGATQMLEPWFLPGVSWALLQVAFWLGVLGVALPCATFSSRAVRKHRRGVACRLRLDLRHGIVLLLCLAPIPLLAASNAPNRYGWNLLPFVAVLLARGCASPAALLGRWLGAYGYVAAAILTLVLLVPPLQSAQDLAVRSIPPISQRDQDLLQLTQTIAEHFPGDSAIVTPVLETAAMLSRPHCPRQNCWGNAVGSCLNHIRRSCSGEGPIPLVWLQSGPQGMGDDPLTQAVGAYAMEQYGATATISTGSMQGVLVALPREPDD